MFPYIWYEYVWIYMICTICLETLDSMTPNRSQIAGILASLQLQIWVPEPMEVPNFDPKAWKDELVEPSHD